MSLDQFQHNYIGVLSQSQWLDVELRILFLIDSAYRYQMLSNNLKFNIFFIHTVLILRDFRERERE